MVGAAGGRGIFVSRPGSWSPVAGTPSSVLLGDVDPPATCLSLGEATAADAVVRTDDDDEDDDEELL